VLNDHIAITDFRPFDTLPRGNRFLVYSMFPDAVASVKIGFQNETKEMMIVKIGHSILNKNCRVNVGQLLSYFEGGGHPGAGSCRFHVSKADAYLEKIVTILVKNEADGGIVEKKERSKFDRRTQTDRRHRNSDKDPDKIAFDRRKLKTRRVLSEPRKNWQGSPTIARRE
jgi:hypothetical protein